MKTVSSPFVTFAANYDWQEQERVRSAIDAVMRADPDAIWWSLHDNRDDDRYVLTARRGLAIRNFTLGMICGDIAYCKTMPLLYSSITTCAGTVA